MRDALPSLLVALPLVGAAAVPLVAACSRRSTLWLALPLHGATFAVSLALFAAASGGEPVTSAIGGWPGPWGIELRLDGLSSLIAVLTAGMGCVAASLDLTSPGETRPHSPLREGLLRGTLLLLLAGLLGITATRDVFNLFVFMEIASLSAYSLVAAGGGRATIAAFRYLLAGAAAGSLYLLGVGFLYALTGTLNMDDLAVRIAAVEAGPALAVGVVLITVGLSIKAALFPLHGWLPDAYVFAPVPVTGFIAAVMAKVSAYALLRLLGETLAGVEAGTLILAVLVWLGVTGVVVGGVLALAQPEVTRMLAWSSVSAMGTILLAVAIGSRLAITAALFHIVAHALAKGCLFFGAGGLASELGLSDRSRWSGLGAHLPWTLAALTVAAFSMIGLPPTAGFFSKYLLLSAALDAGGFSGYAAFAALILSSLLGAVYFLRLLEAAWFRAPARGTILDRRRSKASSPVRLPLPLSIAVGLLAASLVAVGVLSASVERRLPEWPLTAQAAPSFPIQLVP